jgi:hypothetical protein
VANFFLDIAVRDPDVPEEFVAAIECDGAAYHSCKSARDRDRLRQEILENLGWELRRVWSTDWFRNPRAELDRLARELKMLIAGRAEQRLRMPVRAEQQHKSLTSVDPPRDGTTQLANKGGKSESLTFIRPLTRASLSLERARAQLVDLREQKIKPEFPDSDPARGFLRKTMLDELLRKRPSDLEEFRRNVPLDLRERTDSDQVKKYHGEVFEILSQVVYVSIRVPVFP